MVAWKMSTHEIHVCRCAAFSISGPVSFSELSRDQLKSCDTDAPADAEENRSS